MMRKLIAIALLGLLSTPLMAAECATIVDEGATPPPGPRPVDAPEASPVAAQALDRARLLLGQVAGFRKRRQGRPAIDELREHLLALDPVLARLATDDVTWTTPGPPDIIPYAGIRTGRDQVAEYFTAFGSSTETTAFDPQHFFADGDMVVVLGHYTLKVVKTGKVIDNDWVHSFTITGGRISAFEGFEDSAAVVAAFSQPSQPSQPS